MFRENDAKYLLASVAVAFIGSILSAVYEVSVVTGDTSWQTAIAILKWHGVIIPVTIYIIAIFEVLRVIADRIIARRREKDREEGRQAGFQAGFQEGRQEVRELMLAAFDQMRDGETLEQAASRLEAERRGGE